MNKEKVKLIIHNMEILLNSLKEEVSESSVKEEIEEEHFITPYEEDYDEVFTG